MLKGMTVSLEEDYIYFKAQIVETVLSISNVYFRCDSFTLFFLYSRFTHIIYISSCSGVKERISSWQIGVIMKI